VLFSESQQFPILFIFVESKVFLKYSKRNQIHTHNLNPEDNLIFSNSLTVSFLRIQLIKSNCCILNKDT